MKTLCIIPARGGSKRLPHKNILPVAGKPLLAYSVEHAVRSTLVDKTVVSTDDEAIASVAKEYGAEVIERPLELASDTATSESALLHTLDLVEAQGFRADLIVFLQCTSSVRRPQDIDDAIKTLLSEGADSLFSATESRRLLWRQEGDKLSSLNYDYCSRQREQDMPEEFLENGSIFVFKPWVIRQYNNRLGGKIAIYEMDYWSSFQIDSLEDFQLCEWVISQQCRHQHVERR